MTAADAAHLHFKPKLARRARLKYDETRKAQLLLLPERVIKLNSTGSAILKLCDGSNTVAQIAQLLEAEYGESDLEPQVLEFVRDVQGQGWLES